MTKFDPVAYAQDLIRRPSVTPVDAGALDILQTSLDVVGFKTRRMPFGEVDNLYARLGTGSPHFCFAGHTDVVPTGDPAHWADGPFDAKIKDGFLFGRGAADMKGSIAAFIAALTEYLAENGPPKGSISLLITGDEEGPAIHGTKAVLEALAKEGETFEHVIMGEPTCAQTMGDMLKQGRRGSMNGTIHVRGSQGHVAYPERFSNPITPLVAILGALKAKPLDDGNEFFGPSNLEITTVDVGNPATNVTPEIASARFNIRFNTDHTSDSLKSWIDGICANIAKNFKGSVDVDYQVSGEAFLTPPGAFTELVRDAAETVTGQRPVQSTTGGTSDARFFKDYAEVLDFGLVGTSMHKIDENVPVADIVTLTQIYRRVLDTYFARFAK